LIASVAAVAGLMIFLWLPVGDVSGLIQSIKPGAPQAQDGGDPASSRGENPAGPRGQAPEDHDASKVSAKDERPTNAAAKTQNGSDGRTYVVQSGDTLTSIAAQTGTTVKHLRAANDIEDPDLIQPGQTLRY
jgi:LysM repeat protein